MPVWQFHQLCCQIGIVLEARFEFSLDSRPQISQEITRGKVYLTTIHHTYTPSRDLCKCCCLSVSVCTNSYRISINQCKEGQQRMKHRPAWHILSKKSFENSCQVAMASFIESFQLIQTDKRLILNPKSLPALSLINRNRRILLLIDRVKIAHLYSFTTILSMTSFLLASLPKSVTLHREELWDENYQLCSMFI